MLRFVDAGGLHYTNLGDKYPTTGGLQASVDTSTNGRWGGRCLSFTSNAANSGFVRLTVPSAATYIAGLAFKPSVPDPAASYRVVSFREGATLHVALRATAGSGLDVMRGDGTVLGTASGVTSTSQYYYVEVKVTVHDTTGSVVVRVNGVAVITLTNVDTRNGATGVIDSVQLGTDVNTSNSGNQGWRANDVYFADTTGTYNNDFLGDLRVEVLYPSANGSVAFTPSTGSNFQCVDEAQHNADTDFVASNVLNAVDRYAYGDLVAMSGAVLGVCVNTVDRKEDAGARTMAHVVFSGTQMSGAAFSPTTSYFTHQTVFETKPDDAPWTIADVNGMEAGIKIIT